LDSLSEVVPGLSSAQCGSINVEELPELKSIFVVDNTNDPTRFAKILESNRFAADFREILIWREDARERQMVGDVGKSLSSDDVINLQFTRYIL